MRILPIINRLKAEVPLLNGRVEVATSVVALPDNEVKEDLPIAFVYCHTESPGGEPDNEGEQVVTKTFTVLIAGRNINSNADEEPLEELREQIKAALRGWVYEKLHKPTHFSAGNLIELNSRFIWWADTYTTSVTE